MYYYTVKLELESLPISYSRSVRCLSLMCSLMSDVSWCLLLMQQSSSFYRRGRELPAAPSSSLCVRAWLPRSWVLQRRRSNPRRHGLDCLACHGAAETPGLHLHGCIRLQAWSGPPWMDMAPVLFKRTMSKRLYLFLQAFIYFLQAFEIFVHSAA